MRVSNEPSWPDDAPDWLGLAVFVGPLAVYFAVGTLVPSVWERVDLNLNVDQSSSVALVCVLARLGLVGAAVVLGLRWVTRCFPFSVTPLAVGIGVVGGAIWIGCCRLNLESRLMTALGLSPDWLGQRDGINPCEFFPGQQRALGVSCGSFRGFGFGCPDCRGVDAAWFSNTLCDGRLLGITATRSGR